ncbi:hypothetical protein HJC23_012331 [Cyclotella cryptica]|uniref:Ankyrin repeat protein n=1 Tax=Cyclotella cryptica TaxID=29204 RepID=A0ABD3QD11_9STRA|eukprot:CCRYP_006529-RA/>CCRYP_006529-RA protein AED:0.15 eAED:-0.15 QI:0/-1/0/1/-1/1/1/0/668
MSTPDRSRPRRNRPPTSAPVPIPPNPPSELLQLISSKSWQAVVERCASHPQELGSSPCFRNERGYTALHCVLAYNRCVAGEDLVHVVNAILRAAEEINWGSEYTLNEGQGDLGADDVNTNLVDGVMVENAERKTGGSWRLLIDQKNDAQWSPLHLVFVLGGTTCGKVPLARALLQMNTNNSENEDVESQHHRHHLLLLGDRQKRTILHHNCETRFPTDDNFEAAHFLLSTCPSIMFSRDSRGKTPLAYVLDKLLKDVPMTTSGNLHEEGSKRCYRMLKLLVSGMEMEERRRKEQGQDEVLMTQKVEMSNETEAFVLASNRDREITGTFVKETGFAGNRTTKMAEYREVTEKKSCGAPVVASNRRVAQRNQTESRVAGSQVTETSSSDADIVAACNSAIIQTIRSESGVAAAMRNLAINNDQTQFGATINPIINSKNITPRNILHSACRLSKNACPSDGSLILFLASPQASLYEYGNESVTKMADEQDELGNYALHVFLSNESYAVPNGDEVRGKVKDDADESTTSTDCVECQIVGQLLASYPVAISTPNNAGSLPLKLAMNSGIRYVIAMLVDEYPEAVLLDPSLENSKVFIQLLGCMSLFATDGENNGVCDRTIRLSTIYFFVRSRPDLVTLGGSLLASSGLESTGSIKDHEKSTPLLKRWLRKWLD